MMNLHVAHYLQECVYMQWSRKKSIDQASLLKYWGEGGGHRPPVFTPMMCTCIESMTCDMFAGNIGGVCAPNSPP